MSFKAFKLHETNVPVGVVTRFATIGESASGSVFVSLLYTKATIARRTKRYDVTRCMLLIINNIIYICVCFQADKDFNYPGATAKKL